MAASTGTRRSTGTGCWRGCSPGFPSSPRRRRSAPRLDENLAPQSIAQEVAYFGQPNRKSFERTYGWAWLLELAAELRRGTSPDARRWAAQLQPLADAVAAAFQTFLPKQTYPIRTGVHPNSAFSLDLALDYARTAHDEKLSALIEERARTWFLKDREAPLSWEPGGEDFLSPALEEAALMSRLLTGREGKAASARWLRAFLPGVMKTGKLEPAVVSDRTDPKIVHLDGLNLSRARCLYDLAAALGAKDPHSRALLALADVHAQASLPHIASGSYEGEHWLATFAVRALDARAAQQGRAAR